jgi:hypothetical protein
MPDDYQLARAHRYNTPKGEARSTVKTDSVPKPARDSRTLTPDYLLHHQNTFDKNRFDDQEIMDHSQDSEVKKA